MVQRSAGSSAHLLLTLPVLARFAVCLLPAVLGASPTSLAQHWRDHPPSDFFLDRWMHYAQPYETHLPAADGTPLRMLEIGVSSGGSAIAWKRWYGPSLTYVGADLNPACKRTESVSDHRFIEIGSQEDPAFLQRLCSKYGPFDIIIDDGAHIARMVRLSLQLFFESSQCMRDRSIYVIEDLHTLARCAGPGHDSTFCNTPSDFGHLWSEAFLGMHNRWKGCKTGNCDLRRWAKTSRGLGHGDLGPHWASMVSGIHLYDSIAFLTRSSNQSLSPMQRLMRGNRSDMIKNVDAKLG